MINNSIKEVKEDKYLQQINTNLHMILNVKIQKCVFDNISFSFWFQKMTDFIKIVSNAYIQYVNI